MNKRVIAPVIFCLLGLAILSNRLFMSRQVTVRLNQNTTLSLPIDSGAPTDADRRSLLIAIPSEGFSELPQPPRDTIEIKTDPPRVLGDSWVHLGFQTDLGARPSVYLFQSVLNL